MVGTMLRAYVDDKQKKWDAYIPEMQYAIRSAVSAVTGFSPQFLVFGHDVGVDGRHHLLDVPEDLEHVPEAESRAQYASNLERLQHIQDEVNARLVEAQSRGVHRYNLRRRQAEFRVGDKVLRKFFTKSNKAKGYSKKLVHKNIGPYEIIKKLGSGTYLLRRDGEDDVPVHADQLSKFES